MTQEFLWALKMEIFLSGTLKKLAQTITKMQNRKLTSFSILSWSRNLTKRKKSIKPRSSRNKSFKRTKKSRMMMTMKRRKAMNSKAFSTIDTIYVTLVCLLQNQLYLWFLPNKIKFWTSITTSIFRWMTRIHNFLSQISKISWLSAEWMGECVSSSLRPSSNSLFSSFKSLEAQATSFPPRQPKALSVTLPATLAWLFLRQCQ